jgi:hypothetical protein
VGGGVGAATPSRCAACYLQSGVLSGVPAFWAAEDQRHPYLPVSTDGADSEVVVRGGRCWRTGRVQEGVAQ